MKNSVCACAIVLCFLAASSCAAVVYVDSDSPGPTFDGNSWGTAYHTIQAGLNDADAANEEVWVAAGTYYEKITLKNGVGLFGGYSGVGAERDPAANVTIIDGGGSGNVVTAVSNSILDGFTVRSGANGIYASNPPAGLTITGNTFTGNTSGAVTLSGNVAGTLTFAGNSASGNKTNGVKLDGVAFTANARLTADAGLPYACLSTPTVAAGKVLTIDPGAVLKFAASQYLQIDGSVICHGTAGAPITFTSLKDDTVGGDTNNNGNATLPARGDWCALSVTGPGSEFQHCVVRYGGYGWSAEVVAHTSTTMTNCTITESASGGIYVTGSGFKISDTTISNNSATGLYIVSAGAPEITGCTFESNGTYGAVWLGNPTTGATLTGNTFTNNTGSPGGAVTLNGSAGGTLSFSGNSASGNKTNGVKLDGVAFTANARLTADEGLPYACLSTPTVNAGKALTIDPGAVLKFGRSLYLQIDGSVNCQGTAGAPITFTSLKDDTVGGDTNNNGNATLPARGDWCALSVTGPGSEFQHCVVRYGGYGWSAEVVAHTSTTMTNCTVTESASMGLYSAASPTSVRNCIIAFNTGDAVRLLAGDTITYSDLYGNRSNGTGPAAAEHVIFVDPELYDVAEADYRLGCGSPCVDAGDPGIIDADGSPSDMGALPPWPCVAFAKTRGDDIEVTVVHASVIGGTDLFGSFAYLEDWDRSQGVKAATSHPMATGDSVEVKGRIGTVNGERVVAVTEVVTMDERPLPLPLMMRNKSIGGSDWRYSPETGAGQKGVWGTRGLNNVGLLIGTCGRVEEVGPGPSPGWFKISDGSDTLVKVQAPPGAALPAVGKFVVLTAICSTELAGSDLSRLLLVRYAADITEL